jgi:hypothetical protein
LYQRVVNDYQLRLPNIATFFIEKTSFSIT